MWSDWVLFCKTRALFEVLGYDREWFWKDTGWCTALIDWIVLTCPIGCPGGSSVLAVWRQKVVGVADWCPLLREGRFRERRVPEVYVRASATAGFSGKKKFWGLEHAVFNACDFGAFLGLLPWRGSWLYGPNYRGRNGAFGPGKLRSFEAHISVHDIGLVENGVASCRH